MVNRIIFGGVNSLDYYANVSTADTFTAPQRDISTVDIPGRNGGLAVDNRRYKNATQKYTLFFRDSRWLEAYRNAVLAMAGYRRLEDSRHPDEYRMAMLTGDFSPEMSGYHSRMGEVTLTFSCKPQRFLKDGERPREYTTAAELRNPTGLPALPLLRVYGTGTLTAGGYGIDIAAHGREYVDIDSDVQDCYCGGQNLNYSVSMSGHRFPVLGAGATVITPGAGITKVIVWPRWWKL